MKEKKNKINKISTSNNKLVECFPKNFFKALIMVPVDSLKNAYDVYKRSGAAKKYTADICYCALISRQLPLSLKPN